VAQIHPPALVPLEISALADSAPLSRAGSGRLVADKAGRGVATLDRNHRIAGLRGAHLARADARERALRAQAESERDALLSSTSWRMTAPLRQLIDRIRRPRLTD
jgi:hypothetical protein